MDGQPKTPIVASIVYVKEKLKFLKESNAFECALRFSAPEGYRFLESRMIGIRITMIRGSNLYRNSSVSSLEITFHRSSEE
jgi:hypothetical protein